MRVTSDLFQQYRIVAKLRFQVGFLYFSNIRDMLEKLEDANQIDEWSEGSGWLWRTYTIKGDEATIKAVAKMLQRIFG